MSFFFPCFFLLLQSLPVFLPSLRALHAGQHKVVPGHDGDLDAAPPDAQQVQVLGWWGWGDSVLRNGVCQACVGQNSCYLSSSVSLDPLAPSAWPAPTSPRAPRRGADVCRRRPGVWVGEEEEGEQKRGARCSSAPPHTEKTPHGRCHALQATHVAHGPLQGAACIGQHDGGDTLTGGEEGGVGGVASQRFAPPPPPPPNPVPLTFCLARRSRAVSTFSCRVGEWAVRRFWVSPVALRKPTPTQAAAGSAPLPPHTGSSTLVSGANMRCRL